MKNNGNDMVEIVVHGRGGQGAVTAAQIIAEAAYKSGNFQDVMSFPSFGAERRGAPVQAYTRLARKGKIYTRAQIDRPDILLVLDETIITPPMLASLKPGGMLIVNSNRKAQDLKDAYKLSNVTVATSPATQLCIENDLTVDGLPIINTAILGALAKVMGEIDLHALKDTIKIHIGKKGDLNALVADYTAAVTNVCTDEVEVDQS